jgi:hypothetical protein
MQWRFFLEVSAGRQRGLSALHLGHGAVAASLLAAALLLLATGGHAQQAAGPKARSRTVPNLEALPHHPLPRSGFMGWCGLNDKALFEVEPWLGIFDGPKQASPLTFPVATKLECGDNGRTAILIDDDRGLVAELDIPSGNLTGTLANFQGGLSGGISAAPDLRTIASAEPLRLAPAAAKLKVIQLTSSRGRYLRDVHWSRDASRLFAISRPDGKLDSLRVEVFDAQGKRIVSGPVPRDFLFRDGWFANSQVLYLYFGSIRDEFGSGVVLKCVIVGWKCGQIARNVLDASAGGDGLLAMVRALGKYSNDGDTETFPPRYVAEIQTVDRQPIARQIFRSSERYQLGLSIAPSGTKAILTWHGQAVPGCPQHKQENGTCHDGIMIDLPGNPE